MRGLAVLVALTGAAALGAWAERARLRPPAEPPWGGEWALGADDTTLVFATGASGDADLYVCNLATHQRRLLAGKQGAIEELAVAPDCQSVAYVRDDDEGPALVRRPLGGGAEQCTLVKGADAGHWPNWTATGDAVYFVTTRESHQGNGEADTIWRVDARSGALTEVFTPNHPIGGCSVVLAGPYRGWLRLDRDEADDDDDDSAPAKPWPTLVDPHTGKTSQVDPARVPQDTTDDGAFVLHQEADFEQMKARHWEPSDPAPMRVWVTTGDGKVTTPVWQTESSELDQPRPSHDGRAVITRREDDDGETWSVVRVNPADGSATVLFDSSLLHNPMRWRGPATPAAAEAPPAGKA